MRGAKPSDARQFLPRDPDAVPASPAPALCVGRVGTFEDGVRRIAPQGDLRDVVEDVAVAVVVLVLRPCGVRHADAVGPGEGVLVALDGESQVRFAPLAHLVGCCDCRGPPVVGGSTLPLAHGVHRGARGLLPRLSARGPPLDRFRGRALRVCFVRRPRYPLRLFVERPEDLFLVLQP